MKISKKVLALLITAALVLCFVGCQAKEETTDTVNHDAETTPEANSMALTEAQNLTFTTGSVNGSWYSQAGVIADTIRAGLPSGSTVTVQPGGGVSNIATISLGNADIGQAHTCYANWAYAGNGPFDQVYSDIKGICTLDQMFLLFVADADCGFDSFKEIADNQLKTRITTQRPSSDGGGFLSTVVMEEYGLGEYTSTDYYANLLSWGGNFLVGGNHNECKEFMADNKADLWGLVASAGQSQVVELGSSRDIKFIPIDSDVLDALCEKYGLSKYTVPAGTFDGQTEDYETISVMSTLSANANVDDAVVYNIMDSIAKGRDDLVAAFPNLSVFDPATSWEGIGYDLHPGAAQWYRDNGYMD